MAYRQKLIEVAQPLDAIKKELAREKSICHAAMPAPSTCGLPGRMARQPKQPLQRSKRPVDSWFDGDE